MSTPVPTQDAAMGPKPCPDWHGGRNDGMEYVCTRCRGSFELMAGSYCQGCDRFWCPPCNVAVRADNHGKPDYVEDVAGQGMATHGTNPPTQAAGSGANRSTPSKVLQVHVNSTLDPKGPKDLQTFDEFKDWLAQMLYDDAEARGSAGLSIFVGPTATMPTRVEGHHKITVQYPEGLQDGLRSMDDLLNEDDMSDDLYAPYVPRADDAGAGCSTETTQPFEQAPVKPTQPPTLPKGPEQATQVSSETGFGERGAKQTTRKRRHEPDSDEEGFRILVASKPEGKLADEYQRAKARKRARVCARRPALSSSPPPPSLRRGLSSRPTEGKGWAMVADFAPTNPHEEMVEKMTADVPAKRVRKTTVFFGQEDVKEKRVKKEKKEKKEKK